MKFCLQALILTKPTLPWYMTVKLLLLIYFQVSEDLLESSIAGFFVFLFFLLKHLHIMLGALVSDNPSPFEENDKTQSTKIVLIIVPSFVFVIALCGGVLCVAILYFCWISKSTTGAG